MERLRRITRFWSWLPSFRAVAETEHLPTAAEALLVSAPALSRTVRLLEKDLGIELFERQGRRITLNEAGQTLLAASRDAMRLVHEAMLHLQSEELSGPVQIASSGAITTTYVIPALQELRREHPGLVPQVLSVPPPEVVRRMLRGEIDIAFQSLPVQHPRLESAHLGSVTAGIYCGPSHPIARRRRVTVDDLLEYEFVGPPPNQQGLVLDGWPTDKPRRFGMLVDQMRVGLQVCADGGLLGVFPDRVVSTSEVKLRRLPIDVIPAADMYAAHRPSLGLASHASFVLRAVRAEIEREA